MRSAHLVDRVFPVAPVRQWVLSLPFGLRYRLAYDASLLGLVSGIFARTVFGWLRRQALISGHDVGEPAGSNKAANLCTDAIRPVGPASSDEAQCGAVTFIQRFGGQVNLNVHLHMIALDGIYAPGDNGRPEFHAIEAPEDADVAELTSILAERIPAALERRGANQEGDPEESDPLLRDQPWLADLYASSVCGRTMTGSNAGSRVTLGGDRIDPESIEALSSPRCAAVSGFSLHANVAIAAQDRSRLERLFRYAARPPLAIDRLERLSDGRLIYYFRRPWRDGTTHVIFESRELIAKLADRCGGRMRILSAILSPEAARKILDCLGLPSRAPPLKPAVYRVEPPELF